MKADVVKPEIGESRALRTDRHGSVAGTDGDGRAAPGVAGDDYPVLGEDQHRTGALDFPEHVLNAFHEGLSPDYQQADKLCDVDFPAAELGEIHSFGEEFFGQRLGVVDPCHRDKREPSQMRVDQHWLGVCVADDSDSGVAGEFAKLVFKAAAEIAVLEAVDPSHESPIRVEGRETAAAGPKMAVVICAVEKVGGTLLL